MILLETRAEAPKATLSELLLGTQKGDNETFGKMLQQLSLASEGGKELTKENLAELLSKKSEGNGVNVQLGSFLKEDVLQNSADAMKTDAALLELLHGSETSSVKLTKEEQRDLELLHPTIDHTLPAKELRGLIHNAKSYLQEQISQITDTKEMPKTLKGLVELAQKIGIEVEKITLEQVQPKADRQVQQRGILSDAKTEVPATQIAVLKSKPTEHTTAELVQTKKEHQPNRANAQQTEAKQEPLRSLLQSEPVKSKEGVQANRLQVTEEILTGKPEHVTAKTTVQPEPHATVKTAMHPLAAQQLKEKSITEASDVKIANTLSGQEEKSVITRKSDAQPSPLMQSEVGIKESIPAQAKQPLFASALSELLHGGSGEGAVSEGETVSVEHKSAQSLSMVSKQDPIELKMNEAKQMTRHFVGEIKEAVANYKPPFTRIKIQLNPARLGEVEVTLVQRGNNVHININSNTTAITTLAQNATELKTQLAQNGLSNATMNFSSNSNPEQQQQQQRQHLAELYEQYASGEEFEIFENLELIVPRYV